jgi:hypothetical protein
LLSQFFDSKFVCQSEGREVSRVKRSGKLLLSLNVATKGTYSTAHCVLGYCTRQPTANN